jgi:DNA-binding transcriptional MerR regulator
VGKKDGGHSIGVVADRTGLPVETIRFYETAGLLAPRRDRSGHRRYHEADIIELEVIQALRHTGVPLKDIRTYLPVHTELPARESFATHLLAMLDDRATDLARARSLVTLWATGSAQ